MAAGPRRESRFRNRGHGFQASRHPSSLGRERIDDDVPCRRELDAVADQVDQHLPQERGVAEQRGGEAGLDHRGETGPSTAARGAIMSTTPCNRARDSNSVSTTSTRSPSSLAKSSTSLTISRRFSAEPLSASTYCRCLGSRGISRIELAKPTIPFRGVRISWLIIARMAACARIPASRWAWQDPAGHGCARSRRCN